MTGSGRSQFAGDYDAVVVGAGPYGLSTAAHLLGRGLSIRVFGKPLELWRDRMPDGMMLKSQWWCTNLSDPRKRFTFERFFRESKHSKCYPVPRELFIEYALWFKERAVPEVDETYVVSVSHANDHFVLSLADGRTVRAGAVVMATGLTYYARRPDAYNGLPAELVSHSCELSSLARFRGKRVVVVGRGQSAIEYAVLLSEAGASVDVVSRGPIVWLPVDRMNERGIFEQLWAPNSAFGPGWKPWTLHHFPYFFFRFPRGAKKDRWIHGSLRATAAHWLRERLSRSDTTLHEGQSILKMEAVDGKLDATISDGQRVLADHAILATGFEADINRLTMIRPSLLAEIETDRAVPVLSPSFESSVSGLYFVGLTSLRAFGPMYRFVVGCGPTAERVASSAARCAIDGVMPERARRARAA